PASVSDQTTTRRGRQRTDCDCLILVNSPGEIRTLQRRPGIILRICCRPRSEDASGRRPISIERTVGGSTSPWSPTSETGTQTGSTTFITSNGLAESTSIPPQRPPGLSTIHRRARTCYFSPHYFFPPRPTRSVPGPPEPRAIS